MKLILPCEKYKYSYFELLNSAKKNNDYTELGNAALKDNETFSEMITRLKNRRIGKNIAKRDVPATIYWIIEDDKIVGTIDMRHKLNEDYFLKFGHVAYYIKKEERNKNYATTALNLIIQKYKKTNINKILITCLEDNKASKKVILKNNGVFEQTVFNKVINKKISRYIITIRNEREIKLVKPTLELENNWLDYYNEYIKENNSNPMEYKKEYIYSEWIKKLDNEENGINLEPGRVPSSVRFLMDDDKILGAVSIRHSIDNEFLSNIGGHIGYGIRPSERKKGYGKLILKLSLEECKKLGISKVLVTCVDSNIGSKKIIEANGGILENKIFFEPENDYICRYFIQI